MNDSILNKVESYYNDKLDTFGTTPRGVDWNGEGSQFLRFDRLCQGIYGMQNVSVLDYGCGYGSLINFLKEKKTEFTYCGFDVSNKMIAEGKKLFSGSQFIWESDVERLQLCDFVVSSGIFNVKMEFDNSNWQSYIEKTLVKFHELSKTEFSFNMLSSYSDKEFQKDYLYYADPLYYFDLCKRKFSKKVFLDHGYDLFEFTIRVIK